ncbi:ATP-binding cassette domain-containing protein [Kitasatospora sp. NBC_01250]|uniref:ATP-binding cassette domain-containing protein n=1 Tax=Kitasatospora sp. NBC_01250 TaxID=2903571 RepID=UPI002E3669B3|nr:ATP-binding cassette domain-containing protein [Kitasatospora sp. NBC_01250]
MTIQVHGLTKVYRRGQDPAVADLGFDVGPGSVVALLGPEGAGKTTTLRLMLELERGKGVTLFNGRTYRRLRRPEREVGVLLQTVHQLPGSPGRTARGHLRMLAAAVGVPARRADELLEQTRLAGVAEHRLRSFSPGMNRRLALAVALLGAPEALLLDAPSEGLSPRNAEWLHAFIRAFPAGGGSVVITTREPREAALLADRVVTLDAGRMVADQPVAEFRRTRLQPEVSVRGPQMARLADLLVSQGAEVRRDGGAGLAVSGLGRTEIGELAYRSGILLHELADRVVEQPAPRTVLPPAAQPGVVSTVKLRRVTSLTARERTMALAAVSPGRVAAAEPQAVLPASSPADRAPSQPLPAPPTSGLALDAAPSTPAPSTPAPSGSPLSTAASTGPVPSAPTGPAALLPAPVAAADPVTEPIPQPLTGPDHWNG